MTLALVDCPTGLAGNMVLAALFDLGLPQSAVEGPLAALGLADRYRLVVQEQRRGGLRGLHLEVESLEREPPHRHWGELRQQFERADWPETLRQRVLAVVGLLAEAEAAVHGTAPERVHFHEVGAIDAIADIVGVCAGLLHFDVKRLICTPPPAGHGSVPTAHGSLPLPAPAVLEIARQRGVPLASSADFAPGELTTPTGLALMACWAERFGPAPDLLPLQTGVGLGSRVLDRPNLLRLTLAAPWPHEASASPETQRQPQLELQLQLEAEAELLLLQQAIDLGFVQLVLEGDRQLASQELAAMEEECPNFSMEKIEVDDPRTQLGVGDEFDDRRVNFRAGPKDRWRQVSDDAAVALALYPDTQGAVIFGAGPRHDPIGQFLLDRDHHSVG